MCFLLIQIDMINFEYKISKINQLYKSNIIFMKKTILFSVLLFLSAFIVSDAKNIHVKKDPATGGDTRQRAPMRIPFIIDLSTTDLYLNFTSSVDIATIVITDSNGAIVQQESIDTNVTTEIYIPINELEIGDYTITISYGSITLAGIFRI